MKTNLSLVTAAMLPLLTGCVSTFKEVTPLSGSPPPAARPSALAMGDLKVTDKRFSEPEQKTLLHAFQLGVEKSCVAHGSFGFLEALPATNGPTNALVLNGTVTEIEKGSAAARFWVGMGAGQERVVGEFVLADPGGSKLTSFTARKSYLGGSGIGGWDMLKLEELMTQLGELVAETADKWVRGEKIK